ncbi:MAG: GerMN domain-containing protein [bacterium]
MKETGSIKIFLIVILCLIIMGVIVLLWMNNLNYKELISQEGEKGLSMQEPEDVLLSEVKLYFGADGNVWQVEKREISSPSIQLEDRVKDVVDELLKGPEKLGYTPIPKGTQLIRIFLDQDGIVYLDLSEDVRENHPGGTWGEMMTIYSLVNTVMENFNTINGVKIMIMGKEIETLKGHIDTRYPFSFRDYP